MRSLSQPECEEIAVAAHYQVGEIARLLSVSPRTLDRRFREAFGKSPQEWVHEVRRKKAEEMLRQQLPVKLIAYELGYRWPSDFCRAFRKTNQTSPLEFAANKWRKMHINHDCA